MLRTSAFYHVSIYGGYPTYKKTGKRIILALASLGTMIMLYCIVRAEKVLHME